MTNPEHFEPATPPIHVSAKLSMCIRLTGPGHPFYEIMEPKKDLVSETWRYHVATETWKVRRHYSRGYE